MSPVTLVNPPQLADPTRFAFSQLATVAPGTRLVYTAGIGGGKPDGTHDPDFAVEVRQCLANLRSALDAVGGSLIDVAKLTILVVDFDEERHGVLTAALRGAFGPDRYPASTLIPVPRLAGADMLIEIEAVGVLPA